MSGFGSAQGCGADDKEKIEKEEEEKLAEAAAEE